MKKSQWTNKCNLEICPVGHRAALFVNVVVVVVVVVVVNMCR